MDLPNNFGQFSGRGLKDQVIHTKRVSRSSLRIQRLGPWCEMFGGTIQLPVTKGIVIEEVRRRKVGSTIVREETLFLIRY